MPVASRSATRCPRQSTKARTPGQDEGPQVLTKQYCGTRGKGWLAELELHVNRLTHPGQGLRTFMLAGSTVCCGDFVGIGPAFRCSVVTDATGAPRAVLVGLITYEAAKNLSKICKPLVICSNQIAGITLSLCL